MSNLKLVLTDIDGTIVRHHEHTPSKAVQDAIRNLQASGIQLTAATGRPYEMARELFLDIGLSGLGIFEGGASIRKVETGEIVWRNWLAAEQIKTVTRVLLPYANEIDVSDYWHQQPPEEIEIENITKAIPYVYACIDRSHKHVVLSKLQDIPGLSVHIDRGTAKFPGSVNFQITDVKADKLHAVQKLREIVHSTIAETLAIGDSSNDLPLFNCAGLKIAMGNATDDLKQAADFIANTVENDGFAEAMNKFVLT